LNGRAPVEITNPGGIVSYNGGANPDQASSACLFNLSLNSDIAGFPGATGIVGVADQQAVIVPITSEPASQSTLNLSNGQFVQQENTGSSADPVSTATGELFDDEIDISLGGHLPLSLIRHYGSNWPGRA